MSGYQPIDWYEVPRWYDAVFDVDTEREADFLEAVYRASGPGGPATALEPACGSGRLLSALAARGWQCVGFDRTEEMLRFAQRRVARYGRPPRVFRADLTEFGVAPRFGLAHCLVSTFKYIGTEAGARAHLEAVARALHPGGLYVLGFHLSEYGVPHRRRERWVVDCDGAHVTCNIQLWPPDARRRTERVRSRLIVREHGRTRRFETTWSFRTYDVRQVERLLRAVPWFELAGVYTFDYDPGRPAALDDDRLDKILVLRRRKG